MQSLAKLHYLWSDGADDWDLYNLMDEIASNRHSYTDEEYRLSIIGYTKDGEDIFTKTCIKELHNQFPEYDFDDDMENEDPIACPYNWMDPQDYILTGRGPKEDAIKYVDTHHKLITRALRESCQRMGVKMTKKYENFSQYINSIAEADDEIEGSTDDLKEAMKRISYKLKKAEKDIEGDDDILENCQKAYVNLKSVKKIIENVGNMNIRKHLVESVSDYAKALNKVSKYIAEAEDWDVDDAYDVEEACEHLKENIKRAIRVIESAQKRVARTANSARNARM